jgi:hypothetical protein
MSEQSGYGKMWSVDPRSPKVVYIHVKSDGTLSMYIEPPPFKTDKWVGNFGDRWQAKRIKRGWLFSTFIITIEDIGEIQYKTDNQFGDMIEQYTRK